MEYSEALEWLKGTRSVVNTIPQEPFDTWQVRTAQADAAMTQQAYYVAMWHWHKWNDESA